MMKIVVASDSFKGSLSSREVAEATVRGIRQMMPVCEVVGVNVADGGEGTVDAVVEALGGKIVTATVNDPLGRPILARYGVVGKMAVIEMAAASGLTLLTDEERNPWLTSTYGTGEIIMDAVKRGCRDFLVGLGGSATNDAGMGMLQALGFRFYDIDDQEIIDGCGGRLQDVARIDDTGVMDAVRQCRFTVACDVDTPFCGSEGAAYVFAPQKGADMEMVARLDSGMVSFAKVIEKTYGIDVTSMAGAGAAGGMGGGFYVFMNATLKRGVDMVLDAIDFDSIIRGADLVITGEGKIDYQTVKGKTAAGVLARAKAQDIPVVAIVGRVEKCESVEQMGFAGVYAIWEEEMPLEVAMQSNTAAANVEKTVKKIVTNLHMS
ncbi:MAG: glycerate kinase [Paludibacteraceae bacterium]|nr:glycerate kinase [Paludibacteraceae bacterium]